MRFDTTGLVEDEARHAYLDRLDGIVDTDFLAPFAAQLDAYRLDTFSVICLTATGRRTMRTAARIAHDRYDSIGVQYIVSGKATGEAKGRAITSDPGTVMILDYGQPFSVTDLDTRVVVNIAVPRRLFPQHAGDPAAHHGAVVTGPTAALLARFMDDLGRTLGDLPASAGPALARVFIDLLGLALGEGAPSAEMNRNMRLIRRAERLVDDRIASASLDPAWLAARLNLSRTDLYAVMEPYGGVARFILYRRLTCARLALEDSTDDRRIGTIAFAYGFSSDVHFARAFRTAFGITATQARQRARTLGKEI